MNELKIPAFSTKCKIFKYLTVSFEGELNRFPDKSFNCRINATPSSSGLSYSSSCPELTTSNEISDKQVNAFWILVNAQRGYFVTASFHCLHPFFLLHLKNNISQNC